VPSDKSESEKAFCGRVLEMEMGMNDGNSEEMGKRPTCFDICFPI